MTTDHIVPGHHLGDAVSAYLDGELAPPERRRAEMHLAGCDLCRDELSDMMFVRAQLRALPMLELPAELMGAAKPVTRIYRRPRFLVGAAAAAVATMLALSAVAPARDVVDISGNEFSMSFGARASLDQNQVGRVVPIESLIIDESDSGVSG